MSIHRGFSLGGHPVPPAGRREAHPSPLHSIRAVRIASGAGGFSVSLSGLGIESLSMSPPSQPLPLLFSSCGSSRTKCSGPSRGSNRTSFLPPRLRLPSAHDAFTIAPKHGSSWIAPHLAEATRAEPQRETATFVVGRGGLRRLSPAELIAYGRGCRWRGVGA